MEGYKKMGKKTENNRQKAKKIINALVDGASFGGFSFSTYFKMWFFRESSLKESEGIRLPIEFEINILSDWWFDSKEEWRLYIKKFDTANMIEPDEPIKAFELAKLRWMNGAEVELIEIEDEKTIIYFRNGKSISILNDNSEDYAWTIEEYESSLDIEQNWSITCEDKEIFVMSISE